MAYDSDPINVHSTSCASDASRPENAGGRHRRSTWCDGHTLHSDGRFKK